MNERINSGEIRETGKAYPINLEQYRTEYITGSDGVDFGLGGAFHISFRKFKNIRFIPEYFNEAGQKFAYIKYLDQQPAILPNVGEITQGTFVLYGVRPLSHIVDEASKTIVMEKAILSGLEIRHYKRYIRKWLNGNNSMLIPSNPVWPSYQEFDPNAISNPHQRQKRS